MFEVLLVWVSGTGELQLLQPQNRMCDELDRLLGVEVLHPGFKSGLTVLWCKNEVERDVSAAAARPVCAAPDVAAAGDGGRHQQPVPAQLDVRQAHALPTGTGASCPQHAGMHNRVEQLGL